jgi:Rrf2 family iron-sulfur cluster assembly transcriptional regulator
MFSKACEYGIRASIFIAEQSLLDRKVSLKDVAEAIESPSAYTSKILQRLSKATLSIPTKDQLVAFQWTKVNWKSEIKLNCLCN